MITSTTVSLMQSDRVEDLVSVDNHLSRITISIGAFTLGLSSEQFRTFTCILLEKYQEYYGKPKEINLQLGDSLDIKDSL